MNPLVTLLESDLVPINQALEDKSTEAVLAWVFAVFPRVALLTSGQLAGSVLAKIISHMRRKVDLVYADTGVLFRETIETLEALAQAYDFPLKRYASPLSMAEQTQRHGVLYLTRAGQEQCCHMRKVEPLLGLHHEYQALLGALRRDEGGRRAKVPIVSLDPQFQLVRINPLATMPHEVYERYAQEPDTLINPLHFQGYPTIGCDRCTTPVRPDEPERAGRWRHLSGVDYCGINPSDFLRKTISIQMEEEVVQRLRQSCQTLPSALALSEVSP